MVTVYIYGLKCPLAGIIRYIGKSINPSRRLRRHISDAQRNSYQHHAARWIRKLTAAGLSPELVIIRALADGEPWQDVERELIAAYQTAGMPLTNTAEGGEGAEWIDKDAYAQHLEKVSTHLKEMYGTPESRAQQSQRAKAMWTNPEIRARIIAGNRRTKADPVYKSTMAPIIKEFHSRDEYRAGASQRAKAQRSDPQKEAALLAAFKAAAPKRIQSMLITTATPEYKAMRSRVNKEIASRPEVRAMRAENMKAQWVDPVIGSKRRRSMSLPEVRNKISEARKRVVANPAFREGLSLRAKEIMARPGVRIAKSKAMKLWWTAAENKQRISRSMSKHLLTIDGRTQTVIEWSRESGIKRSTIYERLRQGMDAKAAVFTPVSEGKAAGAARVANNHRTPEYRAKLSAILKASWEKRRQAK